MATMSPSVSTAAQWRSANQAHLDLEIDRLRLRLRRHMLWLRQSWHRDPSSEPLNWAISDDEADALAVRSDFQNKIHFFETDSDAMAAGHAIEELSRQIDDHREEMRHAGALPGIDALAARFDLTSFEQEVILLCLAPELDPAFDRLYAYLHNDATRCFATPHLAITALDSEAAAGSARASFLPGASLRRWRIVSLSPASSSGTLITTAMRLSERVIYYVLGIHHIEERCRALFRPAPENPIAVCQRDTATRIARWLTSTPRWTRLLNLVGPPDSGKLAIAQAACTEAGLSLFQLDAPLLFGPSVDRAELLPLLEREAILLDAVYYLDRDTLKPDEASLLCRELERFGAPLIVAGRDRLSCTRDMLAVDVPRPAAQSQAELWRRSLRSSKIALNALDEVVEQFDFGPGTIARTIALASHRASLRRLGTEGPDLDDIWCACRHQSAPQLEQLARKVDSAYDWDDIVVPPEVLSLLQEIADQVAQRHIVYQSWGFAEKLGRGRGISALFAGPSGTGKTMAAEVLARDLELDLYRIDLAGVVSKYIGETEKNLRGVFDAAERSGCILFFDEADALFGKRSEIKDSHDRYANIEVNYLLQRMEDYRGLAILATNMKSALDNAFLRRLRFIVDFPFPDAAHRCKIWSKVFPALAETEALDFPALARLEIAGGNIRNIAVNAAFLAASAQQPIRMEHVMHAARREYMKIDRLIKDAEFGRFSPMRVHP
jgi:AAA+ superfamily predicted ATPase